MPWVRLDDHFDENPKILSVGPLGLALWVTSIAYSNRNGTDGFIPTPIALRLISLEFEDPGDGTPMTALLGGARDYDETQQVGTVPDGYYLPNMLVAAGLWERVAGGFIVHDYHDYQPTKEKVEADREVKREAGRAGGKASGLARAQASAKQTGSKNEAGGQADTQAKTKPVPVPVPVPVPLASKEASLVRAHEDDGQDDLPLDAREIRDLVISKLPPRYQRDPLTWEEAEQLGQDYAGQHTEVCVAIEECRRTPEKAGGGMPFPQRLRRFLAPPAATVQRFVESGLFSPTGVYVGKPVWEDEADAAAQSPAPQVAS